MTSKEQLERLEQKAETYIREEVTPKRIEITPLNCRRGLKEAFITGYERGRLELIEENDRLKDWIEKHKNCNNCKAFGCVGYRLGCTKGKDSNCKSSLTFGCEDSEDFWEPSE